MSNESPIPNFAGWATVKLGEITTKIGSGATPRGGSETYADVRTNYALVRSQNVFDRRFDTDGLAFISDEQARRLRGAKIQEEDLLLNITGDGITFGRCCLVPDDILPACVNQHVAIIRANNKYAEAGFILSCLTHPLYKNYIESFNSGGSRRAITKGHIESFVIPLPTLDEQRAISRVLAVLDGKIDLNRRMSETIEGMALALFKSWFVDFDSVHAKAEGHDSRLSALLAALFNEDRDIDAEAKFPSEWPMGTLSELCEINPARPLKKGVPAAHFDMASLPTSGHVPAVPVERPFGSGMRFRNGDTLVARITPCLENGKTAYIDVLGDGEVAWGSTEYIVLSALPGVPAEFPYCLARSDDFRTFAIQSMTGTSGRQRVPADAVASYALPIPPAEILAAFGQTVRPLFERVREAVSESRTLAALRDTLLPKLVSGEIRVKDGERAAEAAVG